MYTSVYHCEVSAWTPIQLRALYFIVNHHKILSKPTGVRNILACGCKTSNELHERKKNSQQSNTYNLLEAHECGRSGITAVCAICKGRGAGHLLSPAKASAFGLGHNQSSQCVLESLLHPRSQLNHAFLILLLFHHNIKTVFPQNKRKSNLCQKVIF